MAAEVLSFQQEEGKTAYYATFVSDGNPVTIQIKNKGGYVTAFAGIDDLDPVPLYPNASQYNGASQYDFPYRRDSEWHKRHNQERYRSIGSQND